MGCIATPGIDGARRLVLELFANRAEDVQRRGRDVAALGVVFHADRDDVHVPGLENLNLASDAHLQPWGRSRIVGWYWMAVLTVMGTPIRLVITESYNLGNLFESGKFQ